MSELFDYKDKATDWIVRILQLNREAAKNSPNCATYKKIVRSAEAVLKKRGVEA